MKIYTKGGDKGTTGLVGGTRVAKDDLRVAAYGEVDELCAVIGTLRAGAPRDAGAPRLLAGVQRDLFAIGAQLADPAGGIAEKKEKAAIPDGRVEELEQEIDRREAELAPLRSFILPGGSPAGAALHFARTMCRRAERAVVALSRRETVAPPLLVYLNRLSDLLFVMARYENHVAGHAEDTW